MQTFIRLGIGVIAIALAIAAGTAAYAMRDGSDEPARQAVVDDGASGGESDAQDTSAGSFAAMCAPGYPDCDDMIDPLDEAARCAPEFADCDDTVGVPLGDFQEYPCAADDVGCVNSSDCVTILPAPVDEPIVNDPAVSGPADDLPLVIDEGEAGTGEVAPELTDEELARLEEQKAREAICQPVEECVPGPAVDCGPVDPCVPGPAVDCGPVDCAVGPDGACLAPDCAVSSDGTVSCPTDVCILPAPDLPEETIIERCSVACSSPGFDPTAPRVDPPTDPAIGAPEGVAPCPLEPSPGDGTDAAPPQTEPGVPAPAPAE